MRLCLLAIAMSMVRLSSVKKETRKHPSFFHHLPPGHWRQEVPFITGAHHKPPPQRLSPTMEESPKKRSRYVLYRCFAYCFAAAHHARSMVHSSPLVSLAKKYAGHGEEREGHLCGKGHVLGYGLPMDYQRYYTCLLYTSPSPRDRSVSRMPSSA